MQPDSVISLSRSFNSYTNTRLTEMAARVVEEFDSYEFNDEFYFECSDFDEKEIANKDILEADDNEDGESEFAFFTTDISDQISSPISADDIFENGQILPVYPVFNQHGQVQIENNVWIPNSDSSEGRMTNRLQLRDLFNLERETSVTSFSSVESDDLEGVPEDTYCVWLRKEAEGRCRKSRWRFKNLLHKSRIDGIKDSFVILLEKGYLRKTEEAPMISAMKIGGVIRH